MSAANLFSVHIGNLKIDTDKHELVKLFSEAGHVVNAFIQNQGHEIDVTYGFVRYRNKEEADLAIDLLNNWPLNGLPLRVSLAHQQPTRKKQETETNCRKPLVNAVQKVETYNTRNIEELKSTMLKYGLNEDIPLFIEELKQVEYGEAPIFKEEHSDFNLNLKMLDNLIRECNGPSIKNPTIGRLYSQTTDLPRNSCNEMEPDELSYAPMVNSDKDLESNRKESPTQKPGIGRGKMLGLMFANTELTSSTNVTVNSHVTQGALSDLNKHEEHEHIELPENSLKENKVQSSSKTISPKPLGRGKGLLKLIQQGNETKHNSNNNNNQAVDVSNSQTDSSFFEDAVEADQSFSNLVKQVPKDCLPSMPCVAVRNCDIEDESIVGVHPVST